MRKCISLLFLIGFSLTSCSQHAVQKDSVVSHDEEQIDVKPVAQYQISVTHQNDSDRVMSLLKEAQTMADSENTVIYYAKKFLGLPYVAFTLDQNNDECLVINTKGLDCTTYVENVTALAICANRKITDFKDFCEVLRQVRYIHGEVAYTSRQHYFTMWMKANVDDQLVSWVSLPKSPMSEKRQPHVNYMTTHVSAYRMLDAHHEWLPAITEMENEVNKTEFAYIPKAQLSNSSQYRDVINDGDIIGIVTDKAGLDISHVGFAKWHKDGLHMMHASSLQKKVIDDPISLYGYLQKQKSAVGIVLTRIKHN